MPGGSDADPFVEVADLGKRYGDQWAVRGVDLAVDTGEIFGIVGPNGAGKTTILKVLAGLLEPTEGRARVGDWSTDGSAGGGGGGSGTGRGGGSATVGRVGDGALGGPEHRSRIGYLPEASGLYEDMTAEGYLEFFADLYDVPEATARRRIGDVLDELDLDAAEGKRIGDFSKGMKRKVAIARSLVNDPDLLIYDEPASGLDPVVSATILDLLEEFRGEGRTVLLSAHNLHHVEQVCDRVSILLAGRVVAQGTLAEIRGGEEETRYRVVTSVRLDGAEPVDEGWELVAGSLEEVAELRDRAKREGGRLVEVRTDERSLEEVFLEETERDRT